MLLWSLHKNSTGRPQTEALHGYPVNMKIPQGVSESNLRKLVGNTQHVRAAAAAFVIGARLANLRRETSEKRVSVGGGTKAKLSFVHLKPLVSISHQS